MVNNPNGGQKAMETQKAKYAKAPGGLSAEMARRARMRKTIGKGGFYDTEIAKKAAAKSAAVRQANAKNKQAESED